MHLDVDTTAVTGVGSALRAAAAQTAAVRLPRAPACEDVSAADAIGALLAVSGEQLEGCGSVLRLAAALVETAAADYARAETRAAAAAG